MKKTKTQSKAIRAKKAPPSGSSSILDPEAISSENTDSRASIGTPAQLNSVSSVFKNLSPKKVASLVASNPPATPTPLAGPYPPTDYERLGELPNAYGTGRLFFAARDSYWVYAYWDFTDQQMEDLRRLARHGELKLRVHGGPDVDAPLHQEITVNPAARNWFVNVGTAHADYCAEFGYYDHRGDFVAVSRSKPTHTPPDRPSDRGQAHFVTIPFHLSFRELFELVKDHFQSGEELADVLWRLQKAGFQFPFDYEREEGFSQEQEEALRHLMGPDLMRRIFMGSQELVEWVRRRLREETSSGLFSISSPFGASFGAARPRGFWFSINAELIVYGATEPKATVMVDGKPIALQPDGTFRFQFALPDGDYALPVAATSPDRVETRAVRLRFVRDTVQEGGVGVVEHPEELTALPVATG